MSDPVLLGVVAVAFFLAGMVKGVVGLGLPTVSLALLAAAVGLKEAMVLMLVPSFVTNLWQGMAGGHLGSIIKRFWPMFLMAGPAVWIATSILAGSDALMNAAVLGIILISYATLALFDVSIPSPGRNETWLSPLTGVVAGMATGLTGSIVFPTVLYLESLKMSRDELVQAMGICFSLFTLVLALGIAGHSLIPKELGILSVAGLVPAIVGMICGARVRKKLSEARFRKLFFFGIIVLGAWLALRPWLL